MRKKFVKSDRPTYKRRITKAQEGIKFAKYTALETPQVDYSINNIDNPFSEYNIPVVYNTEKALVVPEVKEVAIKEEPNEVVNNTAPKTVDEPIVANKTVPASRTENNVTPSKFTGSKDFINKMRPIFAAALNKRGIDPKYTDYLVAQSALESKWGKAQSGKFNLGGIKGKGSVKKTREVINGKDVYINDSFRDFDSLEDYADYHVGLLNNKRYKAFSSDDFIGNVVRGGYATDPKYSNILNKFYRQVVKAEYGGIIKYQDGGVAKRDATYVAPRYNAPTKSVEQKAREAQSSSEIITLPPSTTITNGRIEKSPARKVTNTSAGYMSGTDPVAAFLVGNVVANKPIMWAGKAAEYGLAKAGNQWVRDRIVGKAFRDSNIEGIINSTVVPKVKPYVKPSHGVNIRDMIRNPSKYIPYEIQPDKKVVAGLTSNYKFVINKKDLPSYAKPNWQGDEFELLKHRLANGGFDRLERLNGGPEYTRQLVKTASRLGVTPREMNPTVNDFTPEFRAKILKSEPKYMSAAELNVPLGTGGVSSRAEDYYAIVTDHLKESPQIVSSTKAHELAHYTFNPDKVPPLSVYNLPKDNLSKSYLMGHTGGELGTELTARGTQLKGYFGLKEGEPITEDMLRYAADNYVKDRNWNNNMTDFFKGIVDYKEMAKWLSEWSPLVALPILNNKNHENGNKAK